MTIFNKLKSLIFTYLLFGLFINSSKAMILNDFRLEESAKSEKISEKLKKLDGFEKLDFFLRRDCNFKFFIETLNKLTIVLNKSLLKSSGMDESVLFVSSKKDYFDNYAQRSFLEDESKVIIVGDLHGNYYDLSKIIKNLIKREILSSDLKIQSGYKIVSLGDYIDRGKGSAQVLLLLVILKLINPENYIMLKGNHESKEIVDAIIDNLNMESELSKNFLKHYDFISNILKNFLEKDKRIIKSEFDNKKLIIIRNIFVNFFNLLPTVFYLQVSDKTFMFNHGGYSEDFLFARQVLPQFLDSNSKYATLDLENEEEVKARDSLLVGDIYPEEIFKNDLRLSIDKKQKKLKENENVSCIKGTRGGFTCSDLYVSKLMQSSKITAKFFGHTHELIKRIYCYKNDMDFSVYQSYLDGFMTMGTRENPIFNIISGEINTIPLAMKYNPSYLELIVDQKDWYVWGNYLAKNCKDFESKLVPYFYNM